MSPRIRSTHRGTSGSVVTTPYAPLRIIDGETETVPTRRQLDTSLPVHVEAGGAVVVAVGAAWHAESP